MSGDSDHMDGPEKKLVKRKRRKKRKAPKP